MDKEGKKALCQLDQGEAELCPRCGSKGIEKISPNGRDKDRKCIKCWALWNHENPEDSCSIIGL